MGEIGGGFDMKTGITARKMIRWACLTATVALLSQMGEKPLAVSAAQKQQSEMIRVGIFTGDAYAEQNAQGNWSGIDVEMVENVAQTAGLQVTFVEEESVKDAFAQLDAGRIDMLADIAKTDEREQRVLYSEYEQGNVSTNLFVLENDSRWNYGDVDQIRTMKFGCEQENISEADFRDWCSQYNITPTITEFRSGKEAADAVATGKVDAYIDGEDSLEGFRSILRFSPAPYFFVFQKQNTALKIKIDAAMGQIYGEDPLYEKELLDKYIGLTQGHDVGFTKQEKAYIKASPVINVAVLEHDEPYFSGTQENPGGIIPAFFSRVAEKTGLSFRYRIYGDQKQAIAAVNSGEADLIGVFSDGLTTAYSEGLNITRKYTTVSTVMITKTGTKTEDIHKIAVKDRSRTSILQGIQGELKNSELVRCSTAADCFDALTEGKTEAVIIGLPSATYLVNQTNSSAFVITPVSSVNLELCAATRGGNYELVSVLNKGINAVSYTINGIIASQTVSDASLQTAVAKIPAVAIAGFAVFMTVLVLFLLWATVALMKSKRAVINAMESEAKANELKIRAEAADKSANEKNAFISNISHDMRTPLNAVIGLADLALQEQDPTVKADYLTQIKSSGELLNSLINDFLTISKTNSGRLQLQEKPLDTGELIRSIQSEIQPLAEKKGVQFLVDTQEMRRRTVLADQLNLEKIFLNLLSNAVKFTSSGKKVIFSVQDDPQGGEDPALIFVVRDSGIGITPEFLPHIFEPFSQEKRKGYESVGTGLGLSIVKQLVELMHGSIEVQSTVGEGSAFTVRMHLRETDPVPAGAPEKAVQISCEGLNGKKVLLCEDNRINTVIAVKLLSQIGMTVVTAENGEIGVRLFSESGAEEFAAILMDVRMPVMDGLQAAEAIRQLDRPDARTIPILAMTADVFEEDIRKCADAGMNGHITKPIHPDQMYAAICKVLPA